MTLTLDLVQEDSSNFVALTMDSDARGIWPLYLSVSLRKSLNGTSFEASARRLRASEQFGSCKHAAQLSRKEAERYLTLSKLESLQSNESVAW